MNKKSRLLLILLVSLFLPFGVSAKSYNWTVNEDDMKNKELISGDDVEINNPSELIPYEDINPGAELWDSNEGRITNFEYYIIDSVDSNGNIKYKKYDFSTSANEVFYPKDFKSRYDNNASGYYPGSISVINFNSCQNRNITYDYSDYSYDYPNYYKKVCKIILPAVNGENVRWRFDNKNYGNKTKYNICSSGGYHTCEDVRDSNYVGTYEYYTSYVYKLYQVPEEKPSLKVTCDDNKLKKGTTSKCKVSFSYKYALNNVSFNISSDKLKISNFKPTNNWSANEITNGYSLEYSNDDFSLVDFKDSTEIATFEVSSEDATEDKILALLKSTDFKYIDKLDENTLSDIDLDFNVANDADKDNKINNIINPNTFSDSYYLIVAISLIGLICFIQVKSKAKSK